MKTKLVLSLMLFAFVGGYAQDYAFKVLVNKGKNEVKTSGGWQAVKVGTSLKSPDELKVSENAYVGLVHVSGKPLEVKEAGKYKVDALAAKVSGGSSVLNKYTDFILSSNATKKNNLAATGAVHRGLKQVHIYAPASQNQQQVIYNDEIILNWDTQQAPGPYIITINSLFDDELFRAETKDSFLKINLADSRFTNEDNINLIITPKNEAGKASEKYALKRASKADKERIKNLLGEIATQVSEPNALNMLYLAGFYEENGLLIDAATAHRKAILLEPDVPYYVEKYNDFLSRNGLLAPKE